MTEDTINLVLKRCRELTTASTDDNRARSGLLAALVTCSKQKSLQLAPVSLIDINVKDALFFVNTLSLSHKPVATQDALISLTYNSERFTFRGSLVPASQVETSSWWLSRSREEQLLAWSSNPDHQFISATAQEERVARCSKLFPSGDVPRPADWAGYRIRLQAMEYQMYGDDNISLVKNFHHHMHVSDELVAQI